MEDLAILREILVSTKTTNSITSCAHGFWKEMVGAMVSLYHPLCLTSVTEPKGNVEFNMG